MQYLDSVYYDIYNLLLVLRPTNCLLRAIKAYEIGA